MYNVSMWKEFISYFIYFYLLVVKGTAVYLHFLCLVLALQRSQPCNLLIGLCQFGVKVCNLLRKGNNECRVAAVAHGRVWIAVEKACVQVAKQK